MIQRYVLCQVEKFKLERSRNFIYFQLLHILLESFTWKQTILPTILTYYSFYIISYDSYVVLIFFKDEIKHSLIQMLTDMNQSPTTLTLFCIKFNIFKRLGMAVGRFDHLEGFGISKIANTGKISDKILV